MTGAGPSIPPNRPAGVRTTRRRGRTSAGQTATLAALSAAWRVDAADVADEADQAVTFGRPGPFFVDIGVGNGSATVSWAAAHPAANVLAVELHRPGVVKLLRALDDGGPPNVRVLEGDALVVLDALGDQTVTELRVLFPDPWPKRRHVARRLVDRSFVATVTRVLVPRGRLHLATDWADYAEHMRTMVATEPRLVPDLDGGPAERGVTTYERRGIEAGRTIVDLAYRLGPADLADKRAPADRPSA